ncbi:2-amino-4, 5-dihydroxy-6-oxo-7-(phosphonooxy)heptanoate synthase [Fundidesulfovibrio magnetotacticus]|uniref:2-amino-3,7-dideoxy-D-threo-hept-6-ulosonate synthase n=1 Tax=Fundidesulfovibrio magnetotacticus TaxID=2730080 RepID=A0A6V8LSN1_9BACT|nr:2-amino-3,7-dideoxy-D-threo-hept-6-ulosonate synthase [Fundidesulfovibrio magnetotacticus]GFK93970.1 2-amino-4, 5-dihydroxy-6-oxo-7-(phosphonooxy)heptanoate synthase [Fundidesulfovibrio magnetotacticus]
MLIGKAVRLERIFNRNNNRTIVVPMDHGVTVGPIDGLIDMRETINQVAEGGANAVLMHKGLVRCSHRKRGRDVGLIIHLSASTTISPFPNAKTLVATVEDALKLGADGVSLHINLGDETERHMLEDFGHATSKATEWGMPVLAMVYARGPKVKNEYDPATVAHCARVGMELGADVVKVPYTGDVETFAKVCESCCIPVVIAGGPKLSDVRDLVTMAHDSVQAGGSGLSIGRNIFQYAQPSRLVQALHGVVHLNWEVEQAMELLKD